VSLSVDGVQRNAAMAAKLMLPFPLLADEAAAAAAGWGVYDESRQIARTAIFVVGRDLSIPFRYVGHDFADRPPTSALFDALDAVKGRGARSLSRAVALPGPREPRDSGKRPIPLSELAPYFRGAHYAVEALSSRTEDAAVKAEAKRYQAMLAEFQKHVAATTRLLAAERGGDGVSVPAPPSRR
jgi:hypothetical protein